MDNFFPTIFDSISLLFSCPAIFYIISIIGLVFVLAFFCMIIDG